MLSRGNTMNTDMSRRQFVGLAGSLATVLGLGLVGCGGGAGKGSAAGSAAAKDVKGAAESKKLVVGFDKSYPPYGFVGDDGEYTGFDLDLAKAVADKQAGMSITRPSIGMPRTRCSTPAPSTASGTALPWRAVRTATRSPSRTCSTSKCSWSRRTRVSRAGTISLARP